MDKIMILRLCLIFLTECIFFSSGNKTVTDQGYWSSWFNTEHPSHDEGDDETYYSINLKGFDVCPEKFFPYLVECRTIVFDNWVVFREEDAYLAPDILHNPCTRTGLVCRNADQPMGVTCRDYEVRFYCLREGKDKVVTDNSSMIALAAGLTFLFPIVVALAINMCKQNCCKNSDRQTRQVDRSVSTEPHDQQAFFDPPPSYNCLFGNNPTTASTEYLVSPTSTNIDNNHQNSPNESHSWAVSTIPASNNMSPSSAAEIENRYQQFREKLIQQPGMHLSVMDLLSHSAYGGSITPPPTYTEALVMLATLSQKPEEPTHTDENS